MHWTLQGAVWLLAFLSELTLAIAVFRRRLQNEFPLFASYVVVELVRTIVLAGIGRHHPPYFYAYWISECLVSIFGFFVIQEIFWKAFEKRLGLQKLGDALFRYSLVALVIASVAVATVAPGSDADKLFAAILVLKRTQSFVRVGLVVSLFFFVTLLGLSWSDYVIGVAAGFAVHGIGELAILILRMHYGSGANDFFVWSTMGMGLLQLLIWIAYLVPKRALRSRTSTADTEHFPGVAAEVGRMNEAVESLLGR